jgi:hypothetical protein
MTWSLLQVDSPWQTPPGERGLVRELTGATSRSLHFSSIEPDTLDFTMPGRSTQTAALVPLVSDVLVYRDDVVVQRFRIVSRVLSKNSGMLEAQFSCVSYRGLLDAWLLHGSDTRSFDGVEQTEIAWTLLNTAQSRSPSSTLGIARGPLPTESQTRELTKPDENYNSVEYFDEGAKIGETITTLAEMDKGFEFDIVPDPANPYAGLVFMTWTVDDGGRGAGDVSSLLLNDGGSVASWSHTVTPAEYANVIRFTGGTSTETNYVDGIGEAVWQNGREAGNTGESPAGTAPDPPEGRWEQDVSNSDLTTIESVAAGAPLAWAKAHDYTPEIAVELARDRWKGPEQLWIGGLARTIITEPVAGAVDEWVLYIDELTKVVEVDVNVDDLGTEDVSLSLNRPRYDAARDTKRVYDRLTRIERR